MSQFRIQRRSVAAASLVGQPMSLRASKGSDSSMRSVWRRVRAACHAETCGAIIAQSDERGREGRRQRLWDGCVRWSSIMVIVILLRVCDCPVAADSHAPGLSINQTNEIYITDRFL
jgi:hypothetical protein